VQFFKSWKLPENFEIFLGQKVQVWQDFWRTVGKIVKNLWTKRFIIATEVG